MTPLLASELVVVRVVMLVEMRSLYAMSDERAVRFRMIVDGTVLAPLHTGLLNRRLAVLVSDVHGSSKNAKWCRLIENSCHMSLFAEVV
jgi:hypothetical protein